MKVKLFKCSRHIYASEYNDYDSVISYLVSQYSDWEEVTQEEYDKLFKWVHRTNDNLKSRNEFYLLVQEPDVKLALEKTAIKEQIAYEEEMQIKREKEAEKRKKEKKAKEAERLRKRLVKLEGK